MAASFSTIAPPAGVLSNTEDVSDRIGAIEISRIDGEGEAMLISAYGTFETCQLHRTMSAFRGNPEDMCSC
jgi:hypothetical protein